MDTVKKSNIKEAAIEFSIALEEVIFCSTHPQIASGASRREVAHYALAESIVKLIEVIGR